MALLPVVACPDYWLCIAVTMSSLQLCFKLVNWLKGGIIILWLIPFILLLYKHKVNRSRWGGVVCCQLDGPVIVKKQFCMTIKQKIRQSPDNDFGNWVEIKGRTIESKILSFCYCYLCNVFCVPFVRQRKAFFEDTSHFLRRLWRVRRFPVSLLSWYSCSYSVLPREQRGAVR